MSDKYIVKKESKGSINIAEDVIVSLIASCVSEIDGVAGFANTAGTEIAELVGLKTVPKGIKVQLEDKAVSIDIIITVLYGKNIVSVAKAVQEAVQTMLASAAGIEDAAINVHVSGISFEKR